MLFWNVEYIAELMALAGCPKINGNQLARVTDLTPPTAYNVLLGAALGEMNTETLRKLAAGLGVRREEWHTLLRWEPD